MTTTETRSKNDNKQLISIPIPSGTEPLQIDFSSELSLSTKQPPTVLTIAGSDPSGGAGVEADLKTITSLKCYGLTCITTLTTQNTTGVKAKLNTDYDTITGILSTIFDDFTQLDAIKVGVVTAEVVRWFFEHYHEIKWKVKFVVIDPIISSSSGFDLSKLKIVQDCVESVYPWATLLTPNFNEAMKILHVLGYSYEDAVRVDNSGLKSPTADEERENKHVSSESGSIEEFKRFTKFLTLKLKCRAVLLKGGHMPEVENPNIIQEILYDSLSNQFTIYKHTKMTGLKNTHGTGCTLSSSISSYLAKGHSLQEAVKLGVLYVHQALVHADETIGYGAGPLNHNWQLNQ
ncbi:unnamed protein product [Ambrosiozyma monospora]|uniref:Unnamed protein product n=1 Tax=Ambrosiozyma monospora TaxID=43982 RepID=A0ACB5T2W6_AMBMO|nr:unnamed protein product [Ambrosiozyma monospora]